MPPRSKAFLVDTNVVLRYLLADDPVQSPRAAAFFGKVEEGAVLAEMSEAVLAETLWVLEKTFDVPRPMIAGRLIPLILFDGLRAPRPKRALLEALTTFAESSFDFVDCLLAARARSAKTIVCTFDATDFRRLKCEWKEPR
jgi:predicted nucleic-acid-binding protein